MKIKNIYIGLFSLLIVFTTACKDSFLDSSPSDSLTTETYYETESDFIQSVNGTYGINCSWRQNMEFFPMIDMATPLAVKGSGRFGQFHWGSSGYTAADVPGDVKNWWKKWWIGIARANEVLKRVEENGADVFTTAGLEDRVKGEALFLRAFYYFNLTYIWGDLPLIVEPVTEETYYPARDDQSVIVQQMIADLTEAASLLPSVRVYREDSENLGRASKGAALSLLGKIYCFQKQWADAATQLKKVIDSGDYQLTPGTSGFVDQFWPEGENGVESIFEIQYTSGLGDQYGNAFITYCATGSVGIDGGGDGYNYIEPTDYLVDLYETKNGYKVKSTWLSNTDGKDDYSFSSDDPDFDASNPFVNRDPRLMWTVMYEGSPYVNEKFPDNTFTAASPVESNYATAKYIVTQNAFAQSDMNMVVLRYADVLLLYAEALMEQNQLSEAATYVNMVRSRPSVSMPGVPSEVVASQSTLRDYIHEERIRELALEYGHAFFDMRRWGTWVDEMKGYWTANKYGHDNTAIDIDDHNVLWPIAQDELDLNSNLIQNLGY